MKKIALKSLVAVVLSLPYVLTNNLSAKADYIHQTLAEYSGTIMEFRIEKEQITVVLQYLRQIRNKYINHCQNDDALSIYTHYQN